MYFCKNVRPMNFKKILTSMLILMPCVMFGQNRNSAFQSYIDRYGKVAVNQMNKYHIPASITLAQGLLESDAGRSMLAVEGNNHFGIKCHSDWKGGKVYFDDDRRGECFRKYASAQASFEDHSIFLTTGSRYSFLFSLKQTDYVGWAKGLKKAGYATNPKYAEKLIEIIETYGLDRFDRPDRGGANDAAQAHQPYLSNGILYVRLAENETLKDIAKEFSTTGIRLRRINEIDRRYTPEVGSVIYLERKKGKAAVEYSVHIVGEDDTLWSISQLYGIRMDSLIRRNRLSAENPLRVGMELRLR